MLVYALLALVGFVLLAVSVVFDGVLDGVLDAGPDWLTGVSIGGFLTVFGFVGVFATKAEWSPLAAALAAALSALAVAALINFIALRLMRSNDSTSVSHTNLVGLTGRSVLGAKAGAQGEVMLTLAGQPLKVNGRCQEDLAPGDAVRVTESASISSVTVEKLP